MLVALGRILQGPPIPIIGGLTLLQLLAMHVPLLLFGTLFAGIVARFPDAGAASAGRPP